MISAFHFLRPWWLGLLPLLLVMIFLQLRHKTERYHWQTICDAHLLPYVLQTQSARRTFRFLYPIWTALLLMIISLAGPAWSKWPMPTYQNKLPRVILLDASSAMSATDIQPNRWTRAKFKLHDLLSHRDVGQFGLLVYTEQPFVVSPLTDDGQTIDALLPALSQDILPVHGSNLAAALEEAKTMITQAGFNRGEILLLAAMPPNQAALSEVKRLAQEGISVSVIPVTKRAQEIEAFRGLTEDSGFMGIRNLTERQKGFLIPFSDNQSDIDQWLNATQQRVLTQVKNQQDIPLWRDEGRWFLIPALMLGLMVFRRGYLQRSLQ